MKIITGPAVAVALVFSVICALPFVPAANTRVDRFNLELKLSCARDSSLQVFYDDGPGFREELTTATAIRGSASIETYALNIPLGTYVALRIDPPDNGAEITIHSIRIATTTGRTISTVDLAGFQALQQVSSIRHEAGRLTVKCTEGGDDPQIWTTFSPPLRVGLSPWVFLRETPPYAGVILALILSVMLVLEKLPRLRLTLSRLTRHLVDRPGRAVAVSAGIAALVSSYPVVFLGRSLVSPNLGTILLYDRYPTLPGYRSSSMTDPKLSDVGAIMWQHVPFSIIQHRALTGGELPLWNRYNALGVPLLGQGQSMFGDPLHFLVIACRGAAWAWDFKYVLAKWLFATGLGLCVVALMRTGRAPPLSPAAIAVGAGVVAAAAPFIGFFIYRINHPAYFSLCYAPWPLFLLMRVARASTRRTVTLWSAALLIANLALMNSGTVKEAYMLLLSVNFAGLCVLLAQPENWREKLSRLATLGWFGLLFALITAPVWNTFLNTLRSAYTGYNAASAFQLQPSLLLGLFDEILYRPLLAKNQVYGPSLNFLLLGGFLLFLATLRWQIRRPAVTALALSSLPALGLAFGFFSPDWIVKVPMLSNIAHLDNTFSCVLIVLWSVLAGAGFAGVAGRLGSREGRDDLVIAGLLLLALVFGWLAFGQAAHRPIHGPTFTVNQPGKTLLIDPFILNYLALLLAALAGLAFICHRLGARRRPSSAAVIALIGCNVLLLWRHAAHDNAVGFEDFTLRPPRRVDFHAKSPAMEAARAAQNAEPSRGYGFHGNFFPGWTGVYRLEGVHGPDALVNPFVREIMTHSGITRMWDWRLYAEAREVRKIQSLFDAFNVRLYFDLASDQGVLGVPLCLMRTADLDVYESPSPWPRAFFVNRVDTYTKAQELVEKMRASDGRPFVSVQADDHAAIAAIQKAPPTSRKPVVTPARDYRLTENSTTFTISAEEPGVVALLEAYWPGDIRATINGRQTPVLRINHAFTGVVLEAPGEHQVTIRYWPRDLTRDLILSGIGAVLLGASLLLALRPVRVP